MERIATYKFNDLNDTGIDKMPVGAQGVVNKFGNLTRFVKGVADASLTPSTTIGDCLTNHMGDYYEDVLYPSNNYVQGPSEIINAVKAHEEVATSGQTTITLDYAVEYPISIYIDNVRLDPSEYTATSGTEIILNNPILAGANIIVLYYEKAYGAGEWNIDDMEASDNINIGETSRSIWISPDGTKVIIGATDKLLEYTFNIPWDITTLTLSNTETITDLRRVFVNKAGTQILIGYDGSTINYIYPLSTAWDISTRGSSIGVITTEKADALGDAGLQVLAYRQNYLLISLFANIDGSTSTYSSFFAIVPITGDDITTIDLSTANDENEMILKGFSSSSVGYLTPDGQYLGAYVKHGASGYFWDEYILSTPFDLTTRTILSSQAQASRPFYTHHFRPDGLSLIGTVGTTLTLFTKTIAI